MLSNDTLCEIVGQEPTDSPDQPGENRRAAPRMSLGRRAQIIIASKSCAQSSRVMLHDISVKGVGFLSQIPLRGGSSFILEVENTAGQPIYLQCNTRRCETGGIGGVSYVVGATFDRQLNAADIPSNPSPIHARTNARSPFALAMMVLRQLNPVRLILHGFKRFDDYSSADDTRWFGKPS